MGEKSAKRVAVIKKPQCFFRLIPNLDVPSNKDLQIKQLLDEYESNVDELLVYETTVTPSDIEKPIAHDIPFLVETESVDLILAEIQKEPSEKEKKEAQEEKEENEESEEEENFSVGEIVIVLQDQQDCWHPEIDWLPAQICRIWKKTLSIKYFTPEVKESGWGVGEVQSGLNFLQNLSRINLFIQCDLTR
jgi:hypothetical protein